MFKSLSNLFLCCYYLVTNSILFVFYWSYFEFWLLYIASSYRNSISSSLHIILLFSHKNDQSSRLALIYGTHIFPSYGLSSFSISIPTSRYIKYSNSFFSWLYMLMKLASIIFPCSPSSKARLFMTCIIGNSSVSVS